MSNALEEAKGHLRDAKRDLEQHKDNPNLALLEARLALAREWIDIERTEKGLCVHHHPEQP